MGGADRRTVDWPDVRDRLARQNLALEEVFAGRGPWADALLDRRAEELAREPATGTRDAAPAASPILVVRGAAAQYGLGLPSLVQVVPLPRVARVPGAAPDLLGVIAVGGRVMRLFDIDRLCGGNGSPGTDGHAVVLRTAGRRPAALRVAAVERIADLPKFGQGGTPGGNGLILGLTAERIAVLDMDAVLAAVTAD